VLGRERVEGQHVGLGVLEQRGDLRQPPLELSDGVTQSAAGLIGVRGGEDLADDRAERVVLIAADMTAQVAQEVHGAALPRRPEDLGQRGLQARVGVGDGELDADQPARDERPEELAPERLGLRLADIEADDLPPARLMHGVRDHDRLARDAAPVADLLDLGVDEQIRVTPLQRPLSKRRDLLVQQAGDPADLAPADAQPEALDELIDPPRRNAADIGLLHHADQSLLAALARLQEAREVAALTDLRICNSISPARVSHRLARYPLRCVARSSVRSPRCAPISSDTSASISSRATALTDSRITSPCSSRSTLRTTSSIVILSAPAIAGASFHRLHGTSRRS
jgi:hypothetical protein